MKRDESSVGDERAGFLWEMKGVGFRMNGKKSSWTGCEAHTAAVSPVQEEGRMKSFSLGQPNELFQPSGELWMCLEYWVCEEMNLCARAAVLPFPEKVDVVEHSGDVGVP